MADIVKKFCNTFLIEGIFILTIGILLLALPQFTTLTMSLMLSIALILGGIYKLVSSIVQKDEIEKSWFSATIAIFMIIAGAYLTIRPLFNLFLITLAVGIYFVLEGINAIAIALESKNILKHWWIGVISGLTQFSLAFVILFGLPGSALYTIGLLIGISMIFSGTTLISVYTGASCSKILEN